MRRRWNCEECGRTLRARLEVRVMFHSCRPPRHDVEVLGVQLRPPDTIEDQRSALWDGFAAALPGEALLRRVDD